MYVLEVIPLSRTAPSGPLSYRSSVRHAPGTLIDVPLRRQVVPGLVVSSQTVQEAKADLKSAHFALAKSSVKSTGRLAPALLSAAQATAEYHATTLGSVLAALLVPVLSEEIPGKLSKGDSFEEKAVEQFLLDRYVAYAKGMSKIDAAQKGGATLLVVPTIVEAKAAAKALKAHAPLVLTSALTPKRREEVLRSAPQWDGLVIVTPSFAFVPILSLRQIIVERASAGSYVLPKRPYVDVRIALRELARARSIPISYGDYPLPLEYRPEPEKPLSAAPKAAIQIIDAREAIGETASWKAIPVPVLKEIRATLKKGGTVAVLAVRRGYAPSVVCRDCGTTMTDEQGRTLSVATENGVRVLRSADGITIQSAKTLCKHCGSWNLMPLGIGVERAAEELAKEFPEVPLVRLDADTVSAKKVQEINGRADAGKLIVGTELLLPYLSPTTPVSLAVIASADSLLALPFWRARERFVRVALMLAERSEKLVIVTRRALVDTALSGITDTTSSEFWKEELELRKLLKYPPFGTLVVFHAEGSLARIREAHGLIVAACSPHKLLTLPERPISPSAYRGSCVLHLAKNEWPDSDLAARLSQLPPFVRIHIDSETFW